MNTERITSFTRDGLVFTVHDAGPVDGIPVVLLHGFPQDSRSWDAVSTLLHTRGYRTIAPDQRGYSPGARPRPRRAYRPAELTQDIVTLIQAAGQGPVHLVGHDWGAVVAWQVAAVRPDLLRSLTALSVPHPAAFLQAVLTSSQARRSRYMLYFQLPRLPERRLTSGKPWERFLRSAGMSPKAAARDADLMRPQLVPGDAPVQTRRGHRKGLRPHAVCLERPGCGARTKGPCADPRFRHRPLYVRGALGRQPLDTRGGARTAGHAAGQAFRLSAVRRWLTPTVPGRACESPAACLRSRTCLFTVSRWPDIALVPGLLVIPAKAAVLPLPPGTVSCQYV
jgi:pimeloyl-ACP methyl ester carboxylesterase